MSSSKNSEHQIMPSFWCWFICGYKGEAGYKKLLNKWLILHTFLAVALVFLTSKSPSELAIPILLPLAGTLIGLSFAWVGNALAILQTDELEKMTDNHPDGIANYIYYFQMAILILLVSLCFWGVVGLGVFDYFDDSKWVDVPVKFSMFFIASISIRECWNVVLFTQMLLMARVKIRKVNKAADNNE